MAWLAAETLNEEKDVIRGTCDRRESNALLSDETKVKDHIREVLDGHSTVILNGDVSGGSHEKRFVVRTTEVNALPMARKTLLFASSGWRMMCIGRGSDGRSRCNEN